MPSPKRPCADCSKPCTGARCKPCENARRVLPVLPRLFQYSHLTKDGCWQWTGAINGAGYGNIGVNHKTWKAHRLAYETLVGPIPEGYTLDHLCRNRACINPDHLEPVTFAENVLRGEGPTAVHARKTHCPKGHPYDDENTRISRGRRHCKTCTTEHNRTYTRPSRRRSAA